MQLFSSSAMQLGFNFHFKHPFILGKVRYSCFRTYLSSAKNYCVDNIKKKIQQRRQTVWQAHLVVEFPVWTLPSSIWTYCHQVSFCMKLSDFEDWKWFLGKERILETGNANLIKYKLTYAYRRVFTFCCAYLQLSSKKYNKRIMLWL